MSSSIIQTRCTLLRKHLAILIAPSYTNLNGIRSLNCCTIMWSISNWIIIVVIITWPSEIPSQKKLWHHSYQGLWFVQMGHVYAKFRAWCHSFQPLRSQYVCFVVFCLLFQYAIPYNTKFLIQLLHRIKTDSKQLPWSPDYPSVTKHFRCKCLWRHAEDSTQKHIW